MEISLWRETPALDFGSVNEVFSMDRMRSLVPAIIRRG